MLTLWLIVVLLETWLCFWLWLFRQDLTYPAFVSYVTFQVGEAVALLYLKDLPAAYFYTYWSTAAVDVILKLWLVIELLHSVYRIDLIEREVIRRFYALFAIIGLLSFALAFYFPSQYPVRLMAVIRTADIGASLTLCCAFLVMIVGAWWEGFYWLNRARGIGYGLMLYLPLKLALAVVSHSARRRTIEVLNWFELFAFLGALLIWMAFFARPEVSRVPVAAGDLWRRMRAFERSNVTRVRT